MPNPPLEQQRGRAPRLLAVAVPAVLVALVVPVVPASAAETGGTKLTHSQAAARLRSAGIGIHSSGNCSDWNNRRCTSLTNVNSGSIDGIIRFRQVSGCGVTVTGGTEVGHASGRLSHRNGYKLDISPTSCVSGHITRNYRRIGTRGDGAALYRPNGSPNTYARESNHWDITYP